MRFLNPIPNGKMDTSMFSDSVEFASYPSDTIISPEDGVVISSDNYKCGGNIKIEHFIDGQTYYSDFCNVDRIMSFGGQRVRKGEIIGTVGDSPIKYTITDSRNKKQNVRDFIIGGMSSGVYSKKTDDVSSDKVKDDTSKKEKNKKEDSKILSKGNYKNRREPSYYEKTGTMPNPFIDAMILPFHLLNSIRMKEGVNETNDVLNEEVNKIKKLIKY
jgi:hypothetical protein